MAKNYDLRVKFRSNQKRVKGASPHPHILECIELADFILNHGELPALNSIRGKKIKHRNGDPEPRARASIIIRKWAADNGIELLDEIPSKLNKLTKKEFPLDHHIASIRIGPLLGGTYISFFPKGVAFRGSSILIKETVMYEQINFKAFDPNNPSGNDAKFHYVDDDGYGWSIAITLLPGFGKLQHQLGVVSAIAYLDQRDF
jgi:hypothetical protein